MIYSIFTAISSEHSIWGIVTSEQIRERLIADKSSEKHNKQYEFNQLKFKTTVHIEMFLNRSVSLHRRLPDLLTLAYGIIPQNA